MTMGGGIRSNADSIRRLQNLGWLGKRMLAHRSPSWAARLELWPELGLENESDPGVGGIVG